MGVKVPVDVTYILFIDIHVYESIIYKLSLAN